MAYVLSNGLWTLDSPGSGSLLDKNILLVRYVLWDSPDALTDHKIILQDKNGTKVYSLNAPGPQWIAPSPLFGPSSPANSVNVPLGSYDARLLWNGLIPFQIDSGTVYIYFDRQ
jgi:hypothetical protein